MILLECFFSFLLADFVSGFVHWFQDYILLQNSRRLNPYFLRLLNNNQLHHVKPRAFLEKHWWDSSKDLVFIGIMITFIGVITSTFNFPMIVFLVIAINGNQIHKWAHQAKHEKPLFVHFFQKIKILQSPKHHNLHHKGKMNNYYCVISNILNPILDKINFWRFLEWLFQLTVK